MVFSMMDPLLTLKRRYKSETGAPILTGSAVLVPRHPEACTRVWFDQMYFEENIHENTILVALTKPAPTSLRRISIPRFLSLARCIQNHQKVM